MKIYIFLSLLTFSVFYSQDRLSFIKDEGVKNEIQNSIAFLNKTKYVSKEIKSKVIFITYDIEKLLESEMLGFSYTTSIPLSWATLNQQGQFIFHDDPHNNWLFYNYSKNIVLVFRGGSEYFNNQQMKELSELVPIIKTDILKNEYFAINKGNEFTENYPKNSISMDRINEKFIPVRIDTFDLKTFMEIWYRLDIKEIPVSQTKYKVASKKDLKHKFHAHPK
ncbi:hypothetical protein OF897_21380 [Chryseobacterium formosus]|uniref:Uncharacterized protein n=1 Tax=Chryseobacterium formosus TaxID=1537363 RepID=A0ABT3XXT5_9FLAO|nr:hypothetical protein [Chryseobacterium formosus]MCX8526469.1 hypothetical protein [Chryseobacterium formosus]